MRGTRKYSLGPFHQLVDFHGLMKQYEWKSRDILLLFLWQMCLIKEYISLMRQITRQFSVHSFPWGYRTECKVS